MMISVVLKISVMKYNTGLHDDGRCRILDNIMYVQYDVDYGQHDVDHGQHDVWAT